MFNLVNELENSDLFALDYETNFDDKFLNIM